MFKTLFNANEREIKRLNKNVERINELEPKISSLTDEELKEKTDEFKNRLKNGETLDELLVEAFAVVREASKRVLEMRHFDVQLIGGMVLHKGNISEMRTGEGKTLVATLPAYLNALTGEGVHVVTVNEYLAQRDAEEMGKLFTFLGLTVGVNINSMTSEEKRAAYACDITYGTNSEFGFDYLRDNMVVYKEDLVQKPLSYAIVDEVDSILIDEARTPLIISGQATKSNELYYLAAHFTNKLKENEDYTYDIKARSVMLTEKGVKETENSFRIENLYDPEHLILNHHIQNALKAKAMMKRDVDYVVQDGEILIVDEFTGRIMQGRRYSDGLHQAIEAKEGLQVQNESKTLATITLQNYFRMYKKLSGMTGTAKTEEAEFRKIYHLNVVVIPTNKPVKRRDMSDLIFRTERAKYNAVVNEIAKRNKEGQPVLVGTTSIENSERISELLKKKGVKHNILNAKHHAKEAEIIAAAGEKNAVTIATNMAGRGTDIKLADGVAEIGGLHIIGTERHESRRIDNQLRGRSGRQGDPGSTQFVISLEDDLMKKFGAESMAKMMDRLGVEEDEPIESKMVSRAIESAQKRVEGSNFDTRKQILEYDDVMNQQRNIIYKQRREVIELDSVKDDSLQMIYSTIERVVETHCNKTIDIEEWDIESLIKQSEQIFLTENTVNKEQLVDMESDDIVDLFKEIVLKEYESREETYGEEVIREFEKMIILRTVDNKWMEHIDAMDQLRQGIHLRSYAQNNPLQEYQFEGYDMFNNMLASISEEVTTYLLKSQITTSVEEMEREEVVDLDKVQVNSSDDTVTKKPVRREEKVGRNSPCPCGSGKKYKNCHGK